MTTLRDGDIRDHLRGRLIQWHARSKATLIIDELGVDEGTSRVDLAVINGQLQGFEIKSDHDTLQRLPSQATAYDRVFDRMTMICGASHLTEVLDRVPSHWGVYVARLDRRGQVGLTHKRGATKNPHVDALAVAQLLWKDEALAVLAERGLVRGMKSRTRPQLHEQVVALLPLGQLREVVRESIRRRHASGQWNRVVMGLEIRRR